MGTLPRRSLYSHPFAAIHPRTPMKFKLSLIAAMLAVATLAACGGGSDPAPAAPTVFSPATLSTNDTLVGSGAIAVPGKTVKVHYTGYLYNTTVASFKGTQFETSIGGVPYQYLVGKTGAGGVIAGFDQGVTGMKVGGKRTVMIPASLAYGATASAKIPANSGLVFDLELVEVQ